MVKKVKSILQHSKICNLLIEKSSNAQALEKQYGIEWGFNQEHTFDPYFYLRACVSEPITVPAGKHLPIPTGIYLQLTDPQYIAEVTTYHDVLFEQGFSILSSPMLFDYTFRNEIWVLIKNNFQTPQIIQPTKKVAILSIKQLPQTVIKYVHQIEESPWKNRSQKFIQKIKNEIRGFKRGEKTSEFYSREAIERYLKNGS